MLLSERQEHIENKIDNDKINLKSPHSLKQVRNELQDKISQIRNGMSDISQFEDEQIHENYMEFRKRGYWNEKNEKS